MKEGEAIGGGRAEMKRRLIERSLRDDAFRRRLLEDPKGAIEQELGTPVPEEVKIRAIEETPEIVYLVLPPGTLPAPCRPVRAARSPIRIWRQWPAATRGTSRPIPMGTTYFVAANPESRIRRPPPASTGKPPHVLNVIPTSVPGVSLPPLPPCRFGLFVGGE